MKTTSDYEKIIKEIPLAWEKLKKHPHQRTAGVDHESIAEYKKNQKKNLRQLKKSLRDKRFSFSRMRPHSIPQRGKTRTILISTVNDRIVSKAILAVISPKFEAYNSNCDFSRDVKYVGGTAPKFRGVPLAALSVLDAIKAGYCVILEADIKKFFDNVPKNEILNIVAKEVQDMDVLELIKQTVEFKVDEESADEELFSPQKGVAQGSSVSPLLASIYLHQFDEHVKTLGDIKLIRYVDDFIVLCRTQPDALRVYDSVKKKLEDMGLAIHELNVPDKGKVKTRIRNVLQQDFEFLGLHFNGGDIDIASHKKEGILYDVGAIRRVGAGRIYAKASRIERKLRSFIRQYIRPHYSRTKRSLESITSRIQTDLEEDFLNGLKGVLGKNHVAKLTDSQRKRLLNLLGIEINKMIK